MESVEAYVERWSVDGLLSPDLLGELRARRWEKGEQLLRAGDPVDQLLFFVEGRAKVYSRMENGSSVLLRFYRPFDLLGDLELFAFDTYFRDVVAIDECVCLALPAESLRRRASANVRLLTTICSRLGRKLADSNASSAVNLRYPLENRLASYLQAMEGAEPEVSDLGELADLLGASYRQLARVVRRFRDDGLLEDRRGRIAVLDRRALAALARDCYFV